MASKPLINPWTPWGICLCAFIVSVGINFTRVPVIYAFRQMTCDDYYNDRPPYIGDGDRCSVPEIEALAANAVSILGITITINGVFNLIFANWTMRKFGLKTVLVQQLVGPTIRLLCQLIGIRIGGRSGIYIIEISQLLGVVGGSTGYVLILNTFMSLVVDSSSQTNAFGRLQGSIMLGTAVAYLTGGTISTNFGTSKAFAVACAIMVVSTVYAMFVLPQLPALDDSQQEQQNAMKKILAPLRTLCVTRREPHQPVSWSRPLLGAGVFLGVLATGFIPILLQLHATNNFGFTSQDNGYLVATTFGVRSIFLTLGFPVLINAGRRLLSKEGRKEDTRQLGNSGTESEESPLLPRTSNVNNVEGRQFDILFLSGSFFADGILTAGMAWCRQPWQLFLAATLLPLASGSAPAAKGVIVSLCQPGEQANALAGIALLEMLATVVSMSLFGGVFSALTSIGRAHLVFFLNGALALLAGIVTGLVRVPRMRYP